MAVNPEAGKSRRLATRGRGCSGQSENVWQKREGIFANGILNYRGKNGQHMESCDAPMAPGHLTGLFGEPVMRLRLQ